MKAVRYERTFRATRRRGYDAAVGAVELLRYHHLEERREAAQVRFAVFKRQVTVNVVDEQPGQCTIRVEFGVLTWKAMMALAFVPPFYAANMLGGVALRAVRTEIRQRFPGQCATCARWQGDRYRFRVTTGAGEVARTEPCPKGLSRRPNCRRAVTNPCRWSALRVSVPRVPTDTPSGTSSLEHRSTWPRTGSLGPGQSSVGRPSRHSDLGTASGRLRTKSWIERSYGSASR